jgi:hypothetical protein
MAPAATHRFAWDGLSFDIPLEWDLAFQETRLGITRIRLEDPVAVRMSAEWTVPVEGVDMGRIMARFQSSSKKLRAASKSAVTLSGNPAGWSAVIYLFPDGRRLGLAFYLPPEKDLFGFFQIHLDPCSPGEAEGMLRGFMASFQRHTKGPMPWACYDVAFTAPPGFRLVTATFNPGLKRFTFGRSMRRLHVWHVSLADYVLRKADCTPLEWAARLLNGNEFVKGPVFKIRDNSLVATRPSLLPHWHFMELVKGCLTYKAGLRHEPENNRLVLACFQYRYKSDLEWLEGTDLPV